MLPQLGVPEMMVIMVVAVILFGKRLPEVGRSLGKGIIEFKKGLRGLESEFDISGPSTSVPSRRSDVDRSYSASAGETSDTAVPKFEPPTSAPVAHATFETEHGHD